jgi:hypothetical protein
MWVSLKAAKAVTRKCRYQYTNQPRTAPVEDIRDEITEFLFHRYREIAGKITAPVGDIGDEISEFLSHSLVQKSWEKLLLQ